MGKSNQHARTNGQHKQKDGNSKNQIGILQIKEKGIPQGFI